VEYTFSRVNAKTPFVFLPERGRLEAFRSSSVLLAPLIEELLYVPPLFLQGEPILPAVLVWLVLDRGDQEVYFP
jgi:hypothetical protein